MLQQEDTAVLTRDKRVFRGSVTSGMTPWSPHQWEDLCRLMSSIGIIAIRTSRGRRTTPCLRKRGGGGGAIFCALDHKRDVHAKQTQNDA